MTADVTVRLNGEFLTCDVPILTSKLWFVPVTGGSNSRAYVPSALSVTAACTVTVSSTSCADTTSPPTVRALPNSSRAVSVNVVSSPATAAKSFDKSARVEVDATGGPGAKETLVYGESLAFVPPIAASPAPAVPLRLTARVYSPAVNDRSVTLKTPLDT